MCGAYVLNESGLIQLEPGVHLMHDLFDGVDEPLVATGLELTLRARLALMMTGQPHVVRPTDPVPVLGFNRSGDPVLFPARWWLLMEPHGEGWKPNAQFATFNSKIDKVLHPQGTVHGHRPLSFRIVLPAQAYIEWHNKAPFTFQRADQQPVLFGGVAKAYPAGDGFTFGVSIVTLPGHPRTAHIHAKSLPLMLEDQHIAPWLDRSVPISELGYLAEPRLHAPLTIQPMASLNPMQPVNTPEHIEADAALSL